VYRIGVEMSKFQLWSRDEYGQGSIIMTSEDIDEVVKRAKQEVTNLNVNNALTATDRENNWEAYFVDIKNLAKRSAKKYVYGATDVHTKDRVYAVSKNGDVDETVIGDLPKKSSVNIYLGDISTDRKVEKDWIGADLRVRKIENLDHPDLNDKISFFIKKV
jgi:hypothetical protein